jgi:hypothetical protein
VIVAESPKNCPKFASAEDVSVNYYSDLRSTIYDADGSLLAEGFAQSAANAFIRLPGGATARFSDGSLQNYWHADWLGSARFGSTPGRTL